MKTQSKIVAGWVVLLMVSVALPVPAQEKKTEKKTEEKKQAEVAHVIAIRQLADRNDMCYFCLLFFFCFFLCLLFLGRHR